MSQDYSWASAEDSFLPTLAQEDDICHDAGVCRRSPCFPLQKQFCQLSRLFQVPFSVLCPPSLSSECLCFSHRDIYCEALVAAHKHLEKREMVYALPCQKTDLTQWGSNRLTSDFRNILSLVSCCSYAFLVVELPKSISSSEFMKDKLQRTILNSKEQYFVLQHRVMFGPQNDMKEIQSFPSHAKWPTPLHTWTFSSVAADICYPVGTLAAYMGYFSMLPLGKVERWCLK